MTSLPLKTLASATRVLTAVVLLLWAGASAAENLYVIDRIDVGLHEARSRNSAATLLLPSGTEVEVLERDGGFVKVRTKEGAEGWADANYLTSDLPAPAMVAELEAWKASREQELKAAWAEVEALREQLSTKGEGKSPGVAEADYVRVVAAVQVLEDENRTLKKKLSELGKAAARKPPAAPARVPAPMEEELERLWAWLRDSGALVWLGVILAIVFVGIVIGWRLNDSLQRRRHGGFRL